MDCQQSRGACRTLYSTSGLAESPDNEVSLSFFQRLRPVNHGVLSRMIERLAQGSGAWPLLQKQRAGRCYDCGALDDVPQLANIAGPGIVQQSIETSLWNRLYLLSKP